MDPLKTELRTSSVVESGSSPIASAGTGWSYLLVPFFKIEEELAEKLGSSDIEECVVEIPVAELEKEKLKGSSDPDDCKDDCKEDCNPIAGCDVVLPITELEEELSSSDPDDCKDDCKEDCKEDCNENCDPVAGCEAEIPIAELENGSSRSRIAFLRRAKRP